MKLRLRRLMRDQRSEPSSIPTTRRPLAFLTRILFQEAVQQEPLLQEASFPGHLEFVPTRILRFRRFPCIASLSLKGSPFYIPRAALQEVCSTYIVLRRTSPPFQNMHVLCFSFSGNQLLAHATHIPQSHCEPKALASHCVRHVHGICHVLGSRRRHHRGWSLAPWLSLL